MKKLKKKKKKRKPIKLLKSLQSVKMCKRQYIKLKISNSWIKYKPDFMKIYH